MTGQLLRRDRAPALLFAGLVTAVYVVALLLSRRLSTLEGADVLAIAITMDLVLVVPAAYFLLVVRRRGWSPLTLAPVIVGSLLLARAILPPAHHAPIRAAELLLLPVELLLLAWIARRAARGIRTARRSRTGDALIRLREAGEEITGSARAAGILGSELAIAHYLFTRSAPDVPAGSRPFSYHVSSGQAGIVAAFMFLLLVEGLVVHVLVQRWSELAAWLFTAGTIYAALWLLADLRASVRRPLLVTDRDLVVRSGLRYDARVPIDAIDAVVTGTPPEGGLSTTLLGSPSHWVLLRETFPVEGPYGTTRRTTALGVSVDDAPGFLDALGRSR